ncbi:hypothetical protein WOC76_12670 [Methylocystis sp. IM3]|uniref:hypothetical protein n=1 Tax=unclassified Methylocystis TaxID=2625913 RepID=UPI00311A4547
MKAPKTDGAAGPRAGAEGDPEEISLPGNLGEKNTTNDNRKQAEWSDEDDLRARFIISKMKSAVDALICAQITFHLDDVDETHAAMKAIASDMDLLVPAWKAHRRRAIARAKDGGRA